jgi:hypothetical protein
MRAAVIAMDSLQRLLDLMPSLPEALRSAA